MTARRPIIAVLPGDGIGPEVVSAALRVLSAAGFDAEFRECSVGWRCWRERGAALPAETLNAVRDADGALLGAVTSKPEAQAQSELNAGLRGRGLRYRSPIVQLRQELDLYACLRPARTPPGVSGARPNVDILVVRENTEDLYAGVESDAAVVEADDPRLAPFGAASARAFMGRGRVAMTVRMISERASERIARRAFLAAAARGAGMVMLADKPSIMRSTGGLFVECAQRVAPEFPGIALDVENVDATAMRLAMTPERYGVILASNLFGDILSDLAAGLTGGPGLAASANVGERHAVFEPVHGSAPDIAGRGIANPVAAISAGAMLARHVGQSEAAERAERAVERLLAARTCLTRDLGGTATTTQFTDALVRDVENHRHAATPASH